MNDASAPSPYCGPAPVPADLWSAWNLDPVLLAVLGFGTVAMALARAPQRRLYLAAALAVLILAFVTPLCALATALFSARVLHHVLLVAFAAPLLAMVILPTAPRARTSLSLPFIAHLALLWVWHAPTPYAWALTGTAPYWLMELSLLGSAVWLWREILHPGRATGAVLAGLLGTVVQMGFLGALLTFAKQPLFAAHIGTTEAFGLSALEDQQLAGLLMWVPAALPYMAVGLWHLRNVLRETEATEETAP